MGDRYVPDWLTQLQFVKSYYLSGCEAPWILYAEMAKQPAADVLPLFLGFDVKDFVKELFRPKGPRAARHGRKGRKNGKGLPGIPDPADLAAKRADPFGDLAIRNYSNGSGILYAVDDIFDAVGWSVALVEAASELTYSTLAGVLEHQGTKCATMRRMYRRGGYAVNGATHGQWVAFGPGPLEYNVGIGVTGEPVFFCPTGTFNITLAVRAVAPAGSVVMNLRVRNALAPFQTFGESLGNVVPKEGSAAFSINCTVQGPINVALEEMDNDGFWDQITTELQVFEVL